MNAGRLETSVGNKPANDQHNRTPRSGGPG